MTQQLQPPRLVPLRKPRLFAQGDADMVRQLLVAGAEAGVRNDLGMDTPLFSRYWGPFPLARFSRAEMRKYADPHRRPVSPVSNVPNRHRRWSGSCSRLQDGAQPLRSLCRGTTLVQYNLHIQEAQRI